MGRWWVGVAALALAGAFSMPSVAFATSAAAGSSPQFEPGPCPDVVPADPRVECGTVVVPENRGAVATKKAHNEVVLSVVRVRPSTAEAAGPPLLYLSGGPGDASLRFVANRLDDPIVEDREVVYLDLRGIGESVPSLACPEVDALGVFAAPADDEAARLAYRDALRACRHRLVGQGIDLASYDYGAMTADLADLRVALGIDEWDVYGISAGGRLALELVRQHPDGIRSLVLDAAASPQGNVQTEVWPSAARAFDALFAACARDRACSTAYPDLEQRAYDLVDALDKDPVRATAIDPDTGEAGTVVFDDANFIEILRSGLYDTELIPLIPGLLDQLTQGRGFDVVAAQVLAQSGPGLVSAGLLLSVQCREIVPFVRTVVLERQARELPAFAANILDRTFRDECEIWDVGRADARIHTPVRSAVPALLLVGALDPIHPRSSSDAIAKHLANGTVVEFPGLGHGTQFAHACPRSILRAFVLDPTGPVDTSCVAAMSPPGFVQGRPSLRIGGSDFNPGPPSSILVA